MSEEKSRYGFGVIGCGAVSDTHIQAIKQIEKAALVAVCDVREEAARAKADQYGCAYYTDVAELLARDDIDIVNIVVPSGLHAKIGIQAAEAGKHVITTKPIDITLENIDRLIEACRSNGVKLATTHQLRSYPLYKRIKAAVSEGRLGDLLYGSCFIPWFRSRDYYGGGRWQGTKAMDGGGAFADHLYHDIEVEDIGTGVLKFANGAHGIIQGTTCTYVGLPARLELHGTKGNIYATGDDTIQLWQIEGEEEIYGPGFTEAKGGASTPDAGNVGPAVTAHVEQISDVIAAIEEDREPTINGPEARRAVQVILALYESSETGQVIHLD